ncbi:MAG: hypothetical protein KAY83_05220, partial [Agitococcus sp.]|nr:hypothetical protein [Agitococcus sp.]
MHCSLPEGEGWGEGLFLTTIQAISMQPPTLTPHVLDSGRLQIENVTPALYRELLKNAQDCLWAKFEAGESVRLLVEARAEAVDSVLADAWQ